MTGDNGLRIAELGQKMRERLDGLDKERIGSGYITVAYLLIVRNTSLFFVFIFDK